MAEPVDAAKPRFFADQRGFQSRAGNSPQPEQRRRTGVMGIRDLEWGMSGPDVKAIQEALDLQPGLKSPRLDHNGIFGPKTDAKVREFQALKHIPVTGRVGAQTRRALVSGSSRECQPRAAISAA